MPRLRWTVEGVTEYHYNEKNQLILLESPSGKKQFTYSLQGGILTEEGAEGTRRYVYNSRNQQIRVEWKRGIQENRYDAEGLRYETEENGQRFRFVYHNGELLYEGGDREETSYHIGAGIEGFKRNGERFYYHQDEQLSNALITDGTGRIRNHYLYDAFGNGTASQEEISNRLCYTGQQYDQATEQYYLRARYYNPILGRFMQEDEYLGDGLNLYAYCENNPVTYYDPSGYSSYEAKVGSGIGDEGGSKSGTSSAVNSKGVPYPEVKDIRTGQNMGFPEGVGSRVPKESRVGWYRNQSEANLYRVNDTDILCKKDYIDEWYRCGYQTPEGGWDLYEIHHIKPREFGGSADFENMVPLLKDVHRKVVTPWWNGY